MSSLPTRASRRRSAPNEQTISSSAPSIEEVAPASFNQPRSLNSPQEPAAATSECEIVYPQVEEEEPRKCWICLQDDTEDNAEWRTPCSCTLTAHEHCLLEWVAEQEIPRPGEPLLGPKLLCPQCKVEIKLQQPSAPFVNLYGQIERVARRMVLPTAISGLLGCAYSGLLIYGINTMYLVFGAYDARRLLGAKITVGQFDSHKVSGIISKCMHIMDPFFPTLLVSANYKLFLSLPLVAPALVLLRTSLADQASALLLSLYFVNNLKQHPHWNVAVSWPPTPGLTFAALPFLKKAYTSLYTYTFSSLERDWERAVHRQPREGETDEEIQAAFEEEGGLAALDVEWVGQQEEAAVANPEAAGEADENAGAGDAEPRRLWHMHHDISINALGTTVMGALFFPAISSVVGEVLRAVLPPRWIRYKSGGFLREKWARSVVGGCLFVVLKDVVTLYVKWRRATNFGKRRVLNYVGKKSIRGVD
ncbi:RING finger domain protein [Diplocarpon rosae]|nr:RING finger domain protein [Diplocarpon rosae]